VANPVCLIVNPAAGGGRAARVAPVAERALRELGVQVDRADTRDLDHARELAGTAAGAGETIVALGGDGLIGAIADALRHCPGAVLGVIAGGRGNDLARVLGIPEDPREAAAIIAAGHIRPVDLGLVEGGAPGPTAASRPAGAGASAAGGGRAFVGIASAGFDSDANRIANEAPAWLGGLVYVYGALRALAAWRPAHLEIELLLPAEPLPGGGGGDDPPGGREGERERHTFSGYSVGACNSKAYGGGMLAAPDALLDDGLLEVVVMEDMSKLAFLTRILPKVFKGTHVHEPGVHVFRAREVLLSADRPFTMYADGDPIAELPVRVRALAGAITMLVPATASSAFTA
jgi:diacylglycerol kinase family enzyme